MLVVALAAAVSFGAFMLGRWTGLAHATAKPPAASAAPTAPTPSADQAFLADLAQYGISDFGHPAFSQMYEALAHWARFQISPPDTQRLPSMANQVTANVAYNVHENPDAPQLAFSQQDSENLVRAGIHAYCPQFDHLLPPK
ncbi:hypothetical protein AWC14_16830 [Mycobacterium kyorinense]|uniref:DUF732 domain-containing protein n=2 Tax=Mycobacterium kyorinense TaxID=487514 RepID=A0A1X1XBL0_9MYCO|nr:hypothetical protein AWC14_16830 [Mycobacterium kyorinense]